MNRPGLPRLLLVSGAVAGAAIALTAAAQPRDSARDRGHEIAEKHCARCHGIGTRDEISPMREAPPFRRFRERYPIEHLAEAFAEGIVVGHGDMPAFEFQPGEIDALLAYLKSIKG